MQLKSIQEVETLKATIRKVDAEIMHRRLAIRNNTVANAGIARNEVEMMARQQQQRKAYLHAFRGQIEALYHADGGRFNRMRTSFVQPRTPKSERISINETQEKSRQFKTFARDPKTGEYYLSGRKVSKDLPRNQPARSPFWILRWLTSFAAVSPNTCSIAVSTGISRPPVPIITAISPS